MTATQLDAYIASLDDAELIALLASAQTQLKLRKLRPWDKEDDEVRELESGIFAMRAEIIRREEMVEV